MHSTILARHIVKSICSIALPYNHGNKEIDMRFCSIFSGKIKASSQQSICESLHMGKQKKSGWQYARIPHTIFRLLSKLNPVHFNCFCDLSLLCVFTMVYRAYHFKTLPLVSYTVIWEHLSGALGSAVEGFSDLWHTRTWPHTQRHTNHCSYKLCSSGL